MVCAQMEFLEHVPSDLDRVIYTMGVATGPINIRVSKEMFTDFVEHAIPHLADT